jgi:probable metal-binding protein
MSAETAGASTHGHTILRWLSESPMSAQALDARVGSEIGADARFHTCDTTELSLQGLLSLLAERGKIAETQGVWTSDLSKMCAGDD